MYIKKNIFVLILIFLPYSLYAWGDGDKMNDGSCKFDLETGYKDSLLYINNNESFLIMNGGDSKYGTISTIYNALTCKKVTSGELYKSNFSGLLEKKGFQEIDPRITVDSSFQNMITFSKNKDNIKVNIKHIAPDVSRELNNLLEALSDKSASSKINISDSAKKLLLNEIFYYKFLDKIRSLSAENINYNYALTLNAMLNNS